MSVQTARAEASGHAGARVCETGPSARLNAKETWCACVSAWARRWLVEEAVEAASRVEIADGRPFKRACAG